MKDMAENEVKRKKRNTVWKGWQKKDNTKSEEIIGMKCEWERQMRRKEEMRDGNRKKRGRERRLIEGKGNQAVNKDGNGREGRRKVIEEKERRR